MFHLLDLLEKRGDEGQEALERRAAPEALQVPFHRVPLDQQQVAAAVLEAPGQWVAQAVRRVGKVLLRLPVSVLEGGFLAFGNLVANDLHDHAGSPLRQGDQPSSELTRFVYSPQVGRK